MNIAAALITIAVILVGLRMQGTAVSKNWVPADLSRKVAHVGLGLFLILIWLVYEKDSSARWFAAAGPLLLGLFFVSLGSGIIKDKLTVRSLSRSGSRYEMLLGPTLFALPFGIMTLLFWRSPISVTSAAIIVFGDGMAEAVGRKLKSPKIPLTSGKTIGGTLGALVAGWCGAMILIWIFNRYSFFIEEVNYYEIWLPVLGMAVVGALAEAFSPGRWDNLSILVITCLFGLLVM